MNNHIKKKYIQHVTLVFILGLFLMTPNSLASAQDESVFVSETVEDQMEQFMEDGEIPSMQDAIIENNEIKYAKGFGDQTDLDTVFMIGSMQKLFTACCIMQLVEDGKITLDDDVDDYLPYNITHPDYPEISITLRMLLTHSSGLNREIRYLFCWDTQGLLYPEYKSVYNSDIVNLTIGAFMENVFTPGGISYTPYIWQFKPGTDYGYSSVGYHTLKHLIEVLSGTTYQDYVQENILTPMGMNNTGFTASEFDHHSIPFIRHRCTNHEFIPWDGNLILRSTATDMAKMLLMHINEGTYNGVQILEPDTIDQMREIGSPLGYEDYGLETLRYSFGLYRYEGNVYGHAGSSVGGIGVVFYNPVTQRGMVHLQNLNHVGCYNMTDVDFVNEYYYAIANYLLTTASLRPFLTNKQTLLIAFPICSVAIIITAQIYIRRKSTSA